MHDRELTIDVSLNGEQQVEADACCGPGPQAKSQHTYSNTNRA